MGVDGGENAACGGARAFFDAAGQRGRRPYRGRLWGSDLQISGGSAGVLAHGLFGGRVILPVDSAQYLPVARQNTAFQGQTRAVVQRLHLFQQSVLLHLAQDIGDDHGHLVAGGAGEQTVETDVQLSKAAVIAQGLLRRRLRHWPAGSFLIKIPYENRTVNVFCKRLS